GRVCLSSSCNLDGMNPLYVFKHSLSTTPGESTWQGPLQPQFLQNLPRRTFPHRRAVTQISQIFDAHAARPEPGRYQIPQLREKPSPVAHFRPRAGGPCNVVEHLAPLGIRALEKRFVESPAAFRVKPDQATPHGRLA